MRLARRETSAYQLVRKKNLKEKGRIAMRSDAFELRRHRIIRRLDLNPPGPGCVSGLAALSGGPVWIIKHTRHTANQLWTAGVVWYSF